MKNIIVVFFTCLLNFCPLLGETLYVKWNAGGENNGSSWTDAYTSLQSALDIAVSGDQIWVAKGTYYPSSAYNLTNTPRYYHFQMIEGVAIYGGFAGSESSTGQRTNYGAGGINETILSGDIGTPGDKSDNCYHVFYHPDGTGLTYAAVLNGFTITGGNANGSDPHNCGGGIYNYISSPTLTNIVINNNSASSCGGGVCNYSPWYLYYSSPKMTNMIISNNSAGAGGGIYNTFSSPTLSNVIISNNSAGGGGGIFNSDGSNTYLTSVTIKDNSATNGGGLYNLYAGPDLINVVIIGNSASVNGGGIFNNTYGVPRLINVTMSGNSAGNQGGGICHEDTYSWESPTILKNCIVWGNTASNGNEFYNKGSVSLSYCCYDNEINDIVNDGSYGGSIAFGTDEHCITSFPRFAGASNNPAHPYSLLGISPCADAGNDSYCNSSYDIRGNSFPRKMNKSTGETGTIDMGAYEYKIGTDTALPVSLTFFSAKVESNNITLNWQTASETDNLGFILERAEGDGVWRQIASYKTDSALKGQGNNSSTTNYSYADNTVNAGIEYRYRLGNVNTSGTVTMYSPISVTTTALPQTTEMFNAYPNPFNPETIISYQLHKDTQVTVTVYDILGRQIKTLIDQHQVAGSYKIAWNGTDASGAKATSGAYIVRMQTLETTQIQKVLLLK